MSFIKHLSDQEMALISAIRPVITKQIEAAESKSNVVLAAARSAALFAGYIDGFIWNSFYNGKFTEQKYSHDEFIERAMYILDNHNARLFGAYLVGKDLVKKSQDKERYALGNKLATDDSNEMIKSSKFPERLYKCLIGNKVGI